MFNNNLDLYKLNENWERGLRLELGQGEHENYKPWINIRNFHSQAPRYRIYSAKANRLLQLMSNGEKMVFLRLESNRWVKDIREQFPLDPKVTLRLCRQFDINHPGYTFHGQIMTSDFLITHWADDGSLCHTAIQVKQSRQALTNRCREKIKIEQAYWEQKGVNFKLVFSDELNAILTRNLDRIYRFRQLGLTDGSLKQMYDIFEQWASCQSEFLGFERFGCDRVFRIDNFEFDMAQLVKILLAHEYLAFPINKIDLPQCRLGQLVKGAANVYRQ